jgi:hypothetical protein
MQIGHRAAAQTRDRVTRAARNRYYAQIESPIVEPGFRKPPFDVNPMAAQPVDQLGDLAPVSVNADAARIV